MKQSFKAKTEQGTIPYSAILWILFGLGSLITLIFIQLL